MSKDMIIRCCMVLCAAFMLSFTVTSHATELEWDGSTGNWDTDASWLPTGTEPTAVDEAKIDAGHVTIDMQGEVSSGIIVGYVNDAELQIINGGTLTSGTGETVIAYHDQGTVTVSGAGSMWTGANDLKVGVFGEALLNIDAGGVVSTQGGTVGLTGTVAGQDMSYVTITGAGSVWYNNGGLVLGGFNSGTLNVMEGGTVTSTSGLLGGDYTQIHTGYARAYGVANIIGAGSVWTSTGTMTVGEEGRGELNIEAGGIVSNADGIIGSDNKGMGFVTVTGAGSAWHNYGNLAVGDFAYFYQWGGGNLTIEAGGLVTNANATIGNDSYASGFVTVTGSGSIWDNAGSLIVGVEGDASMDIEDGGMVNNTDATIGLVSGSSEVTVTGAGSTWACSGSLYLGGDAFSNGGTGNLKVYDGGKVDVAGTIQVWANGYVLIEGGIVQATAIDDTHGGSFYFSHGTLSTDHYFGTLIQDGGSLTPGHSPGTTTVWGDYQIYAGTIDIELGGLIAEDAYDQLIVTGDVNLNSGGLDVALIDGFKPTIGDQFEVLRWHGTLSGAFTSINLPALGPWLDWDLYESDAHDSLILEVISTLVGDCDGDGYVGLGDLDIILSNWNQFVPPGDARGDVAGVGGTGPDGYIGLDDLDLILANWNTGVPPGFSENIPEPTSLTCLLLGIVVIGRRCQRN